MTEVVDLDDIVFDEVTHLRLRTGLLVDTSRVSAGQIRGQAGMLARVVRNLLDNAARHAHRQISVSLTQAGDEAVLVVADDGPGIRAPDRQRIFERFTRLDDARSRDAGGVGLGLAIVGDVVTAHRGRVLVEDNNPGTRVVVRLPSAPGDGTPA